ncbi:MAG: hypothetical protein V7L29_31135 [Nostoc sp.]|uniref:hypothetical protein n=1 Tax=Nostoc sp. TaxID=1180 RepID=UPI002FFAF9F6
MRGIVFLTFRDAPSGREKITLAPQRSGYPKKQEVWNFRLTLVERLVQGLGLLLVFLHNVKVRLEGGQSQKQFKQDYEG